MKVAQSTKSMTPAEAFRAGVELIGSHSATAKLLGVTQSAISKRIAAGKPIAGSKAIAFEERTGISRHALRPDLYPIEDTAPASTIGLRR